ncbi:TolC family protein [Terriglobus roseus]|uniref:TolC family protein n=1 Tax=Terriglobus roseus TaxID=392734 RepID=UPI001E5DBF38|nr:TolC family protein [Terriglobus roseus]
MAGTLLLTPFCTAQVGGASGAGNTTGGATGGTNAGTVLGQSVGTDASHPSQSPLEVAQTPASYAAAAPSGADPRKLPAAKPGAMTLRQVLDAARLHNPTLAAAEQNLRGVRAQEIQAAVRANPYLGVSASNVTVPSTGNNPYFYAVQVSRLFERGNKREYRVENARATTAQTEAQLQDTVRQTELAVRQAFTTMLIAKAALEISRAQLADFRHEVQLGHDRFLAGDLGKLDYERLDMQLGSFELDEQTTEITLEQASDHLQNLMGIGTSSPDFDVTGPIVPIPISQSRETLTATALQQRPDLRAAEAGVQAADASVKLAVANGTTDPTVEAEYDRNGTDNSAGFNVNIPLRIFDRNQGNKDTARYQAQAARLTEQATRNQIASDVNQAWIGYLHALNISNRFSDHYLDESADVLSVARYAFEHGGLALIDYLDALRDARSSTSDALNAYSQSWMSVHALSAATGMELAP